VEFSVTVNQSFKHFIAVSHEAFFRTKELNVSQAHFAAACVIWARNRRFEWVKHKFNILHEALFVKKVSTFFQLDTQSISVSSFTNFALYLFADFIKLIEHVWAHDESLFTFPDQTVLKTTILRSQNNLANDLDARYHIWAKFVLFGLKFLIAIRVLGDIFYLGVKSLRDNLVVLFLLSMVMLQELSWFDGFACIYFLTSLHNTVHSNLSEVSHLFVYFSLV
jgi:hypothetical protein